MDQVQQHRRGAPQLTPSFMTCSKPLLPAATRPAATGDTIECGNKSDGNDAKAKFIQRHAEESNIWTASDKNGSWTRSTTSGKLRNSGAWHPPPAIEHGKFLSREHSSNLKGGMKDHIPIVRRNNPNPQTKFVGLLQRRSR
ncbi:hypothetical protein BA78_8887 [Aspergillus fumigatus]|nr:hypothetical protein BA78_8887 [Aspergillus fumigatus]